MWISFRSEKQYAIKVYVGAVNVVSGEPAVETAATTLRRRQKLSQGQSIQDYMVVPNQRWLDGVATAVGQVRQFVAMPMGSGHSVEAQITGEEVVGGIQFEITPLNESQPRAPDSIVFVRTLTGRTIVVPVALSWTARDVKAAIVRKDPDLGPDLYDLRLIWAGQQLQGRYIHAVGAILHVRFR